MVTGSNVLQILPQDCPTRFIPPHHAIICLRSLHCAPLASSRPSIAASPHIVTSYTGLYLPLHLHPPTSSFTTKSFIKPQVSSKASHPYLAAAARWSACYASTATRRGLRWLRSLPLWSICGTSETRPSRPRATISTRFLASLSLLCSLSL
jgi:hypothetical protein